MNESYTIEPLALLTPQEILASPELYANKEFDVPLCRIVTEGLEDNPTLIMLGVEKKGRACKYYLVVEDNDMSEDRYCKEKDNSDLLSLYEEAVQWVINSDQEWLNGGN